MLEKKKKKLEIQENINEILTKFNEISDIN